MIHATTTASGPNDRTETHGGTRPEAFDAFHPMRYAHGQLASVVDDLDDAPDKHFANLRYRLRVAFIGDALRDVRGELHVISTSDFPEGALRDRWRWIRTRATSSPTLGDRSAFERSCDAMSPGAAREVADAIIALHRDVTALLEGSAS